MQMQNFTHLINKNSQSMREKRTQLIKEEGNFLGSVKLQDLVAPVDQKAKKR